MGKTIRIRGAYEVQHYEANGPYFHYVVIEDNTACCRQRMEFVWNGDHVYPDDYPEENAEIEVTGIFGNYKDERGGVYYCVAVDAVTVLER